MMIEQRAKTDITVEVSRTPLPLGARMRANSQIMLAWLRRSLFSMR